MLFLLACSGPSSDDSVDSPHDTDTDTAPIPVDDAALDSLDVGAPLSPAFDPDRRYYVVRASDLPDPFSVVAVPRDPAAEVTVRLETIDGTEPVEGSTHSPAADHRVRVDVTNGAETRSYAVGLLPDTFPPLVVDRPGTPSPGWLLLSNFSFEPSSDADAWYLMALDDLGTPGWWRASPGFTFDLRVSGRDQLTYALNDPAEPGGGGGYILDATYQVGATHHIVQDPLLPATELDIHEFSVEPDGSSLVMGVQMRVEDLTEWGGPANAQVAHQTFQQLEPDGAVRFQWTSIEALDYDNLPAESYENMSRPVWEPVHLNSVEVDPFDGHYLVSFRIINEVAKIASRDEVIDGTAYAAGDVIWRLGGSQSDFAFVGDPGFVGQHSARATGPDTVAVFDNDAEIGPTPSGNARFVEYRLDRAAGTATLVAQYAMADGTYAGAMGSVQRLRDGHTVIGWGSMEEEGLPREDATELDADGNVVLEVRFADETYSYRAWKAEGDPMTGTWVSPALTAP